MSSCPDCGRNGLLVRVYEDRTEYYCAKCKKVVYVEYH